MRLIPYFNHFYYSPLPQREILQLVRAVTAPMPEGWRSWLDTAPTQPYLGRVYSEEGTFEVQRNIRYRNSFLPVVEGRVEVPGGVAALGLPEQGSTVCLVQHLRLEVLLFMLVWLGGIGFACIAVVLHSPGPASFVPFLMLGAGILFMLVPFWVEAAKAQDFFKNLLQLQERPGAA